MTEQSSEHDDREHKAPDDDTEEEGSDEEVEQLTDAEDEEADTDEDASETDQDKKGSNADEPRKRKLSGKEQRAKSQRQKVAEDQDSDSEPEIIKGLSGDEVDVSNIVEGGRGTRRGRAQSAATQAARYKQTSKDSDEDSW